MKWIEAALSSLTILKHPVLKDGTSCKKNCRILKIIEEINVTPFIVLSRNLNVVCVQVDEAEESTMSPERESPEELMETSQPEASPHQEPEKDVEAASPEPEAESEKETVE